MDDRPSARPLPRPAFHVALALLLALGAGCAASLHRPAAEVTAGPRPRVALLPLENLTLREDASTVMTRLLFVELVRGGACEMVEAGEVEAVMESLRVRPTGSLTSEQRGQFGARLRADHLVVGSVIESGVSRTPEGDVPAVAVVLRLIEVASGRVEWADLRVRTGDDRERVFGWGRELNRDRLASALATDILQSFRIPAPSPAAPGAAAPPESLRTEAPR
jgi:hypothetical protein